MLARPTHGGLAHYDGPPVARFLCIDGLVGQAVPDQSGRGLILAGTCPGSLQTAHRQYRRHQVDGADKVADLPAVLEATGQSHNQRYVTGFLFRIIFVCYPVRRNTVAVVGSENHKSVGL
ncbi:hypothetical protein ES703_74955 [subsurface metagenome]